MPYGDKRAQAVLKREWQPPYHVSVRSPSLLGRKTGDDSTTANNTHIHIRIPPSEKEAIIREAKKLGLTFAAFVRWSSVEMASALFKVREGHDDDSIDPRG